MKRLVPGKSSRRRTVKTPAAFWHLTVCFFRANPGLVLVAAVALVRFSGWLYYEIKSLPVREHLLQDCREMNPMALRCVIRFDSYGGPHAIPDYGE